MNAYEKAQALGLVGTDEEIVAQLRPITVTPINLAYLMEMLNFRGMLRKTDGSNGQERWQGTLQNLKSALVVYGMTDATIEYETWFSHVTNPRQVSWDTSRPEYAIGFAEMQTTFGGQPTMPSVADFEAVVALGGGRPYVDLTVESYTELRSNAESQAVIDAERNTLRVRLDSVFNQIGTSEQPDAIIELRAIADELEA